MLNLAVKSKFQAWRGWKGTFFLYLDISKLCITLPLFFPKMFRSPSDQGLGILMKSESGSFTDPHSPSLAKSSLAPLELPILSIPGKIFPIWKYIKNTGITIPGSNGLQVEFFSPNKLKSDGLYKVTTVLTITREHLGISSYSEFTFAFKFLFVNSFGEATSLTCPIFWQLVL